MKHQIEQIHTALLSIVSAEDRHNGLNALKEIEEQYTKIENALNMNAAIYEMLFAAADGDISAEDLATAIEKAMELNQDAMGFSNNKETTYDECFR